MILKVYLLLSFLFPSLSPNLPLITLPLPLSLSLSRCQCTSFKRTNRKIQFESVLSTPDVFPVSEKSVFETQKISFENDPMRMRPRRRHN